MISEVFSDRILDPIFNWNGPRSFNLGDVSDSLHFLRSPLMTEHEADIDDWKIEYEEGKNGVFDGHDIRTDPDVFPAEKGDTSRDIVLAIRELQHYHERRGTLGHRTALDMGCGNGAIAITIASLSSFERVYGIDNHTPAVNNAAKNFENCPYTDKLQVIHSDLMKNAPMTVGADGKPQIVKFDLIVFNQPYYPREGSADFGLGSDGGEEIIRRFFEEIEAFIHDESEIIMPFSADVDEQHNPAKIAEEFGYSVSLLRERIDENGIAHRIYRFVKNDVFEGSLPVVTVQHRNLQVREDSFSLAA